jgi:hypothetical protein
MSNLPPSTAPVATKFNLGIDNALITVPQNYTVPANPPSMPNPPNTTSVVTINTASTTVKDSVTIYASSILGFQNELVLSFLIQRIDQTIDSALAPVDATITPADGEPLPILIGDTTGDWVTGTWNAGLNGWVGNLPFNLTPYPGYQPTNKSALTQYVATNYKTLFINPMGTGGTIAPDHPPSYQVNIYAYDSQSGQPSPASYTYAVCNFTLVVSPSVANYGLGVSCLQLTDLSAVKPLPNPVVTTYCANEISLAGHNSLYVKSTSGFHVGDSVIIGLGTSRQDPPPMLPIVEANAVSAIVSPTELTLVTALTYTHTPGEQDSVGDYMLYSYINTVTISLSSFDFPTNEPYVNLYYFFYPLEPTSANPNPITVSLGYPAGETLVAGKAVGGAGGYNTFIWTSTIDLNNSEITFNSITTSLLNYNPGTTANSVIPAYPTSGYVTRDVQRYGTNEPYSWWLHLVFLKSPLEAGFPVITAGDSYLLQVIGQDSKGVTATAYTIIRVTA